MKTTAAALFFAVSLLLSGCAAEMRNAPAVHLQWPPLPQAARVEWVATIASSADVGGGEGWWAALKRLITGEEEVPVARGYGVASDAAGRIAVADAGGGKIHLFDRSEKSRVVLRSENPRLASPIGVAFGDGGRLYATDSATGAVFSCDVSTGVFRRIASLNRPTGIVYHAVRKVLYIVETGNHRVVAMTPDGKVLFFFGARGTQPGEFNFPTDVAVSGADRILVTDALNARVQVFSADGKFVTAIGEAGDSPGTFSKPKGIAADSDGNIYVCDALFDAVQVLNDKGRLLLAFGRAGSKEGEFWMPSGIAIDRDDFIYVTDTYNKRIQVFRYLSDSRHSHEKK